MKMTKPVIIILAVALVAVIGYVFYLYQGPLKNISNENQELKNEIAYLKTASGEIKAAYNSDLSAKIRLEEALQKKNMELEQTVEEIRKEKEMAGTEFQKKIESLEKLLAQNDRNLQIFHDENQQLKTTETELQEKVRAWKISSPKKQTEAQTFSRGKPAADGRSKRHFTKRSRAWKISSHKKKPRLKHPTRKTNS